jgi:hypothetical protein
MRVSRKHRKGGEILRLARSVGQNSLNPVLTAITDIDTDLARKAVVFPPAIVVERGEDLLLLHHLEMFDHGLGRDHQFV